MKSKILKDSRKYAIYLHRLRTSQRRYPVLYLLHGGGDDHTGWVQFGEVQHIADKAIREGGATPMIIVMPDANTGRRGYFNDAKGEWRYEDFFFEEFMPFIEKTYRIKAEKRYRAVAGLSMGGGGSLCTPCATPSYFLRRPLSAHRPARLTWRARANLERMGEKEVSEAQAEAYYKRQSVLSLIENLPEDQKKAVRWYIDCGDDDFLYEGNSLVHIAMRKKEIPHEFRVRDGGHTWSYWRTALPTVLGFISDAFHQQLAKLPWGLFGRIRGLRAYVFLL